MKNTETLSAEWGADSQQRMVRRRSPAMREVIERLKRGETLMWYGMAGPEISGRPFWPQARTVRAMLRDGLLVWGEWKNDTQKDCGIRALVLPPNDPDQRPGAKTQKD